MTHLLRDALTAAYLKGVLHGAAAATAVWAVMLFVALAVALILKSRVKP